MKFKHTNKTFQNQIEFYEKRARSIDLIWCRQILNFMNNNLRAKDKVKINDLGCNYFQFYKEIKRQNLLDKYDYMGYDIDTDFINLGLKHFPELKDSYCVFNIERKKPRKTDISIISATLEHTSNPEGFLNNALETSTSAIFLRTFLSDKQESYLMTDKKYVRTPYYINQFSKYKLKDTFESKNYSFKIIKDEATNYSEPYELFKGLLTRQMYIIFAKKNNNKFFD